MKYFLFFLLYYAIFHNFFTYLFFYSACEELEDLTILWTNGSLKSGLPCSNGPALLANKTVIGNFQLKSLILKSIGFKNSESVKNVNCATIDASRMETFWNEFAPIPRTMSSHWVGLAAQDFQESSRHSLMENWIKEYGTLKNWFWESITPYLNPKAITSFREQFALPWQSYIASFDATRPLSELKVIDCIYSEQVRMVFLFRICINLKNMYCVYIKKMNLMGIFNGSTRKQVTFVSVH